MSITLRSKSRAVLEALSEWNGAENITRAELQSAIDDGVIERIPQWLTTTPELRVDRGVYRLPIELLSDEDAEKPAVVPTPAVSASETPVETDKAVKPDESATYKAATVNYVPKRDKNYVPWGNNTNLRALLATDEFLPIFITGLSGNGKTFGIMQEVAKAKRELFRVNITTATDEDDLLGGFRLIAGDTVWFDGPVVEAMKRGGVLLLDELDLGTEKIMCLQSILEGNGVLLKKTGEYVEPADGFTIIATGNTKGQGDDTDKFVGTNILNEAFLERFPVWLDQPYPPKSIETKIIKLLCKNKNIELDDIAIEALIKFAQKTRATFDEQGCDDLITTRRLTLIVNLIPVFKGKVHKAVEVACNRFCQETRESFVDLFKSIYDKATADAEAAARAKERAENGETAEPTSSYDSGDSGPTLSNVPF